MSTVSFFHYSIQRKMACKKNKGFAMLFTVLIVSIILSITLGISSVSFKQSILSGMVKDSQVAFYQADSATECGLYYEDRIPVQSPDQQGSAQAAEPIECLGVAQNGDLVIQRFVPTPQQTIDRPNYYVYENEALTSSPSKSALLPPCFVVIFDKSKQISEQNIIQGYGYNTCDPENPRRLERGIQVNY